MVKQRGSVNQEKKIGVGTVVTTASTGLEGIEFPWAQLTQLTIKISSGTEALALLRDCHSLKRLSTCAFEHSLWKDLVDLSALIPMVVNLDLQGLSEESLRLLAIKSNSPYGVLFPRLRQLVIRSPCASESALLDIFRSRLYLAPNANIIENTSPLQHAELHLPSVDCYSTPTYFGELYQDRPELRELISQLRHVYSETVGLSKGTSGQAAEAIHHVNQNCFPKQQELGYCMGTFAKQAYLLLPVIHFPLLRRCFSQKLDTAFAALEGYRITHAADILKNGANTLMYEFSCVPKAAFLHHRTYKFHTRATQLLKQWQPILNEYQAKDKQIHIYEHPERHNDVTKPLYVLIPQSTVRLWSSTRSIRGNILVLPTAGEWGSFSARDAPWLLTKVCHSWREVALSTPLLWLRLPMLKPSGRASWGRSCRLQLLELYLKNSAGAALSLAFGLSPNPGDTPFLPLIAPHLSQAQHLKITYHNGVLGKNTYVTHKHFPLLKSLELGCVYMSHAFQTPQAQSMTTPLEGIEFPWAQLTQVSIQISSSTEALALFRDCTSLENSSAKLTSLTLHSCISSSPQDLIDLSAVAPTITELDIHGLSDESLQHLTIKSNSPHGVLFPHLTRLVMTLAACSESVILDMFYSRLYLAPNPNIINNISSLQHVELYESSFCRRMPIYFGESHQDRPELNRLFLQLQFIYSTAVGFDKTSEKWVAESIHNINQSAFPEQKQLGYCEGTSSTVQHITTPAVPPALLPLDHHPDARRAPNRSLPPPLPASHRDDGVTLDGANGDCSIHFGNIGTSELSHTYMPRWS
ncbi:hypothetical protein BD779DRAFT_1678657 [Infundibulicybe gibba]|nr:hypothetical protein BD779DRAFT_1678657 [Infundibulicybe gibba]